MAASHGHGQVVINYIAVHVIVKHTCSLQIFFRYSNNHVSLAMTTKAVPNGSAEPPVVSPLPPVVGINFGNSFASIAVFTKVKGMLFFGGGIDDN
jgi:hypothetical protein